MLKLYPLMMVFEGGASGKAESFQMNGMCVLIKEASENSLSLLPCEDIERCWQSATPKRVLTRTPPCWHPELTLAAPRTVTNKLLSLMSHPGFGTLLEQPELRHIINIINDIMTPLI